jgi:hypothetical protein
MRYGNKGNSLYSLYKMVKAVNDYKKNLTLMNKSIDEFVKFGNKILDFLEFLMIIPQFRSINHFIFNWHSAERVTYCILNIQKLEQIYLKAK